MVQATPLSETLASRSGPAHPAQTRSRSLAGRLTGTLLLLARPGEQGHCEDLRLQAHRHTVILSEPTRLKGGEGYLVRSSGSVVAVGSAEEEEEELRGGGRPWGGAGRCWRGGGGGPEGPRLQGGGSPGREPVSVGNYVHSTGQRLRPLPGVEGVPSRVAGGRHRGFSEPRSRALDARGRSARSQPPRLPPSNWRWGSLFSRGDGGC